MLLRFEDRLQFSASNKILILSFWLKALNLQRYEVDLKDISSNPSSCINLKYEVISSRVFNNDMSSLEIEIF